MENHELESLIDDLRCDSVFRRECFDAVYKKDGQKVTQLLNARGLGYMTEQNLNELTDTVNKSASSDIYSWKGKYRFNKPDAMKKSILTIDETNKEVTINGHILKTEYDTDNTYNLCSSKNTYTLKFYQGENDDETNYFKGTICKSEGGTESQSGETTEGTQEEWYETPAADEYGVVMTILGTFDLALGLFLIGKEFYDKHKEAPEEERDRQEIRDTHKQVEKIHGRMEKLLDKNMEIAAKNELKEKSRQLVDLANTQIMEHIRTEFQAAMERNCAVDNKVDREAVLNEIKQKIGDKYSSILSAELSQYAIVLKQRYFDPFEISYDANLENETIEEISKGTYDILNSNALFEDYCKSFEIDLELKRLQSKSMLESGNIEKSMSVVSKLTAQLDSKKRRIKELEYDTKIEVIKDKKKALVQEIAKKQGEFEKQKRELAEAREALQRYQTDFEATNNQLFEAKRHAQELTGIIKRKEADFHRMGR